MSKKKLIPPKARQAMEEMAHHPGVKEVQEVYERLNPPHEHKIDKCEECASIDRYAKEQYKAYEEKKILPWIILPFVVAWALIFVAERHALNADISLESGHGLLDDGLAPRPISFPPLHGDKLFEEIAQEYQKLYPGQEIWFVKGIELPYPEFEKNPTMSYRSYKIYVRRAA